MCFQALGSASGMQTSHSLSLNHFTLRVSNILISIQEMAKLNSVGNVLLTSGKVMDEDQFYQTADSEVISYPVCRLLSPVCKNDHYARGLSNLCDS